MPNLSTSQWDNVQDRITSLTRRAKTAAAKGRERSRTNQIKSTGEGLIGAAAIGALRGKMEEPNGAWNFPGTDVDIELTVGMALLVGGFLAQEYKPLAAVKPYADDAISTATGILAHYSGQIARKFAKTGVFTMIAGGPTVGGSYPSVGGLPASIGGADMGNAMASALSQSQRA